MRTARALLPTFGLALRISTATILLSHVAHESDTLHLGPVLRVFGRMPRARGDWADAADAADRGLSGPFQRSLPARNLQGVNRLQLLLEPRVVDKAIAVDLVTRLRLCVIRLHVRIRAGAVL